MVEAKGANETKAIAKRMRGIPLQKFSERINEEHIINTTLNSKDAIRGKNIHGKEITKLQIYSTRSKSKL